MTYLDSEAALDALLTAADDEVLARLDDAVDIDGGCAVIFTQEQHPPGVPDARDERDLFVDWVTPDFRTNQFLVVTRLDDLDNREHNFQVIRVVDALARVVMKLESLATWLRRHDFRYRGQALLLRPRGEIGRLRQGIAARDLDREDALRILAETQRNLQRVEQLVQRRGDENTTRGFVAREAHLRELLAEAQALVVRLFAGDDQNIPVPLQ
ncbi:hypothetical protein [Streptomyces sp. HUAS TT7]|uniref:hypothetical protein n=1 Tax=Streptomyces sp. HUAS TT7 TaxID=3447507 RepID=UPI003F65B3B3